MGLKLAYLSTLLLIIFAIGTAGAAGRVIYPQGYYSQANVTALLRSYAVPNAIIINLNTVNITYNGTVYAAMYENGALEFVVNTRNFTFVNDQNSIFGIIRNYTLNQSFSAANFTQLTDEMLLFQKEASPSMESCLTETGLAVPNATCTFQNYCQSCKTVPVCNRVLTAIGGPDTPFGYGIIAFENNYTSLQRNYTQFYAAVNSVTSTDVGTAVSAINRSFANISLIASTIWENPIFPPVANDSLSTCAGVGGLTGNVPVHSADWYCNAVGFCGFLTIKDNRAEGENDGINFTILNNVASSIDTITSLPFTDSQIESIAAHANATTTQYILPLLHAEKSAQLGQILNTTLKGYNASVNATITLLTHVANASLSASVAALQGNYLKLTSQYLNLNLTQYNASMRAQLAGMQSLYSKVNASYSSIVMLSKNNTDTIIRLQLEGNSANPALASLAYREFALNAQVSGKVANVVGVTASLGAVKSGLSGIQPVRPDPISALSRSLGGAAATALVPSLKLPYTAAVAIAPFLAWIPALVIGILGLIAIAVIHFVIKPKQQSMQTQRQKLWRMIDNDALIAAAVILILYMAFSLWFSFNNNNANAPLSVFTDAVARSGTIAIALNGTQSPGMLSCASTLQARVTQLDKKPVMLTIDGEKCVVANTTLSTDTCLNSYAQSSTPVIMLTNSTTASLSTYSFYGTMLTESGTSAELASCSAATALG